MYLQENFEVIDAENADIPGSSYLVAGEQLELTGSFVVVVTQRDAVAPFLDLAGLCPELDVDGVAGF